MALPPASLKSLSGKCLRAVARIFFEHGGQIEAGDGALELYLDDGSVFFLDGSADGERLRVQDAPWVDPFQPPISDENRLYIEQSGKWSRVEQSDDPKFSGLIGKVIASVKVLVNEFGREAGVQFSIGGTELWFVVAGDECHVHWVHPIGFRPHANDGP
ncbi:hypothetical protein [Sorangium cellulosum]|uniref:hypothetical protein n=1 Tax=Sorangium cellulosum TaxID=56 RepID=UPI0013318496|nr:hypothetical protein [Sorangium cellulosum]